MPKRCTTANKTQKVTLTNGLTDKDKIEREGSGKGRGQSMGSTLGHYLVAHGWFSLDGRWARSHSLEGQGKTVPQGSVTTSEAWEITRQEMGGLPLSRYAFQWQGGWYVVRGACLSEAIAKVKERTGGDFAEMEILFDDQEWPEEALAAGGIE